MLHVEHSLPLSGTRLMSETGHFRTKTLSWWSGSMLHVEHYGEDQERSTWSIRSQLTAVLRRVTPAQPFADDFGGEFVEICLGELGSYDSYFVQRVRLLHVEH